MSVNSMDTLKEEVGELNYLRLSVNVSANSLESLDI